MNLSDSPWLQLGAALGIGLLIGVERERRKGDGPVRVPAGVRTFAATSLLGAAAEMVGGHDLLLALVLAVGALVVAAYWRSQATDTGFTTGVALLLTLVLGGLTLRDAVLAAGLAAALAILLASRTWMHHFVRRVMSQDELHDALMLAGATLVIMPLVPDHVIGAWLAFNPRTAWTFVVLVMVVGALGHVAQRSLGTGVGLAATGLVSGFASGVATVGAMGERALQQPQTLRAAVAGGVLASVATMVQMVAVLAATSLETLRTLALPLACASLAAVGYGALFTWRTLQGQDTQSFEPGRAFSLRAAVALGASVSVIMVISALLQRWLGNSGLLLAAALGGLVDTHSTAVAAATLVASGRIPAADAAAPVLVALSVNSAVKAVVAFTTGGRGYGVRITGGLVLMMGAAWGAMAWSWV